MNRVRNMARRRSIFRMRRIRAINLPHTKHVKSILSDTSDYYKVDWADGAVITDPFFGVNA